MNTLTWAGHIAVKGSFENETENYLAKNPEYLKILAEIESQCSEKDQSCGPTLREKYAIDSKITKVTKFNSANQFAELVKEIVISGKNKTTPQRRLANLVLLFPTK